MKGGIPLSTAMAAVVHTKVLGRYHVGHIVGVVAFEGEVRLARLAACAESTPFAPLPVAWSAIGEHCLCDVWMSWQS